MNWYATNPVPDPGFTSKLRWSAHKWARQSSVFASNMAAGGFAASMFPANSRDALRNAFKVRYRENSAEHIRRLEELHRLHPRASGAKKALLKARGGIDPATGRRVMPGKLGHGIMSRAIGGGLGTALIMGEAMMTEGGAAEKMRGGIGGAAAMVGFMVGTKVGGAVGGYYGGPVGAIIGGAVGGFTTSYAAGLTAELITGIPERLVERERERRKFGWVNNHAAFQTQQAATMRQLSLQAMNRGQMSGRSMLGQEGILLHQ